MQVLVGDNTGLVKRIPVFDKRKQKQGTESFGAQARSRRVQKMAWAGVAGDTQAEIASALHSGVVELWSPERGVLLRSLAVPLEPLELVVGLSVLNRWGPRQLLACTGKGALHFIALDGEGENGGGAAAEAEETLPPKGKQKKKGKKKKKGNDNVLAVGEGTCAMRVDTAQEYMATGGKEQLLKVWDVRTQTAVWNARNVPHDFLDMRVPVWVNALAFVGESNHLLVTGTAHKQVRLYDTRVKGRRAVLDKEVGEHSLTAIDVTCDAQHIIVANATGRMLKLDLRTGRQDGYFAGIGGAVRDLVCHATQPLVAECGLDRYLRVYNTDTRKLQAKHYLKQQLNCLVFGGEAAVGEEEDEEEEEEEVWKQLKAKQRATVDAVMEEGEEEEGDEEEGDEGEGADDDAEVSAAAGDDGSDDADADDDEDSEEADDADEADEEEEEAPKRKAKQGKKGRKRIKK